MDLPPELESARGEWRAALRRAGVTAPETLRELESHVLDAWEERVRLGEEPRRAWDMAVRSLGHPVPLRAEFTQVGTDRDFSHGSALIGGLLWLAISILFWSVSWISFESRSLQTVWRQGGKLGIMALPVLGAWMAYHGYLWRREVWPAWWWRMPAALVWSAALSALILWAASIDYLLSLGVSYLLGVFLAGCVGLGAAARAMGRPARETWIGGAGLGVAALVIVSSAWTLWPTRLVFALSREPLEVLADRIEAGETLSLPVWAGAVRVSRVEIRHRSWGGGTCIWVVPRRGGPTGFIRRNDTSQGLPGNNINRRIPLTKDWYFVSED